MCVLCFFFFTCYKFFKQTTSNFLKFLTRITLVQLNATPHIKKKIYNNENLKSLPLSLKKRNKRDCKTIYGYANNIKSIAFFKLKYLIHGGVIQTEKYASFGKRCGLGAVKAFPAIINILKEENGRFKSPITTIIIIYVQIKGIFSKKTSFY